MKTLRLLLDTYIGSFYSFDLGLNFRSERD